MAISIQKVYYLEDSMILFYEEFLLDFWTIDNPSCSILKDRTYY